MTHRLKSALNIEGNDCGGSILGRIIGVYLFDQPMKGHASPVRARQLTSAALEKVTLNDYYPTGALFWFLGRLTKKEADMFHSSLLVDLAKTRQSELLRDVEKSRIRRDFKPKANSNTLLKKFQIYLSYLG